MDVARDVCRELWYDRGTGKVYRHHRLCRATFVKRPIEITSEGPDGPAYVRYSREARTATHATPVDPDVVVDYDRAGNIVGIELVCLEQNDIAVMAALAFVHSLDMPQPSDLRGVQAESNAAFPPRSDDLIDPLVRERLEGT